MAIDLSVIIVNYKSAQLIVDCLHSFYSGANKISFEIIVVDNDSKDNSKEIILSEYPEVKWISMDYNSGFARANNEGIRQAKGEIVLLLNADTLIKDNAVEKCLGLFATSQFVACGVQLLNTDLTPQISGSYFMKGGLNYLLPLPYLGQLIKWSANLFGIKKTNVPDADSTIEVDWVNGAFLMVKKTAIQKAGLLDEDFFLYAEEAEWCSRLKKIGKLCIFGEVKVIHLQGETAITTFNSTDKTYNNLFDRKGLQIVLSNLVRIRKQFGVLWLLIMLFFYFVEIPIFFIGIIISKLFFGRNSKFSFMQFTGYCKNIAFIMRLSFAIISNKPRFYKVL
jgi:GT2 family glycosyltransferase